MKKKKNKKKKYEEEEEEEEEPGCFPDTHAQSFEIALIICFILSCVLLAVNMILTLRSFKSNYLLLILEIIPTALNFISIILSIIIIFYYDTIENNIILLNSYILNKKIKVL